MRVKASLELANKTRRSSAVQLDPLNHTPSLSLPNKTNQQCQHMNRSLNQLSTLKKLLKDVSSLSECTTCLDLKKKTHDFQVCKDTTLWLCLYCAHLGCDRSSVCQHAIKHFKTPRSISHCLCVNTDTWMIWCYECDVEITQVNKNLDEIITFIQKYVKKSSCPNEIPKEKTPIPINDILIETKAYHALPPIPRKTNETSTNSLILTQVTSTQRVCGLSNLGNTCFFNAVLQNLSQTPSLEALLFKNTSNKERSEVISIKIECDSENSSDKDDINETPPEIRKNKQQRHLLPITHGIKHQQQLTINLAEPGAMTYALSSLIRDMNSSRSTMSPSALFSIVCKKVPSFKGFQQQDSHELLRHLLDAIKAEEIKRRQAGILEAYNFSAQGSSLSDTVKQSIRAFGRAVDYTFVDSLYGGHLLSSVYCEQCKTCSQSVEPFLDLSLPIVEEKNVTSSQVMSLNKDEEFVQSSNQLSKNQIKRQRQLSRRGKQRKNKKVENQEQCTQSGHQIHNEEDDFEDELSDDDDYAIVESIEKSLNDHLTDSNEFKLEAMQSVTCRSTLLSSSNDTFSSLQSCLLQFTSSELLTGANKFGCETCTKLQSKKNASKPNRVYTEAKKQYLLCELPAVLTIHLKRFQQHGFRLEKLNKHVNFPFLLDMSPYTSKMCINLGNPHKVHYSLFGLVEHSGSLRGGHYTAYVKSRQKPNLDKYLGKKRVHSLKPIDELMDFIQQAANVQNTDGIYTWYYISDSHVNEVHESKISKVQAYLLFYERLI